MIGRAALFGVGWGLSGFCPGPVVAALATGLVPVFAFAAAMMAGMIFYWWIFERPVRGGAGTEPPGLQRLASSENPS